MSRKWVSTLSSEFEKALLARTHTKYCKTYYYSIGRLQDFAFITSMYRAKKVREKKMKAETVDYSSWAPKTTTAAATTTKQVNLTKNFCFMTFSSFVYTYIEIVKSTRPGNKSHMNKWELASVVDGGALSVGGKVAKINMQPLVWPIKFYKLDPPHKHTHTDDVRRRLYEISITSACFY